MRKQMAQSKLSVFFNAVKKEDYTIVKKSVFFNAVKKEDYTIVKKLIKECKDIVNAISIVS